MYWKLAIQNIRRSLRDYIIYLVTLTLTAALMYSFLALGFSSDVLAMAENMSMLTTGILLMSALVAFMSEKIATQQQSENPDNDTYLPHQGSAANIN